MAKSPFAKKDEDTYHYPAPLEKDSPLVDPEVMDDIAGKSGEDPVDHWVKLRIPRSAADMDAVADYTQSVVNMSGNGDAGTLQQRIGRGNRGVFELLVEAWSFTDRKPDGEDYDKLDNWAAVWVRACLGDANRRAQEIVEQVKKVEDSPTPPESSPARSRSASAKES